MNNTDIVLISNSPGELSSWVKITATRLKERMPECRVVLVLVPCPYATGKEEEVAAKFSDVDVVVSPGAFLQYIFLGRLPDDYKPAEKGAVVFLGGDFWHAAGMAWKLKYPAVAYTARPYVGLAKHFKYIFCPYHFVKDKLIKQGVPADKLKMVGNLTVEGVKSCVTRDEGLKKIKLDPQKFTVGIFPGSRLCHLQDSLPVFLKVAEEIKEAEPDAQFIMGLSPFISRDDLTDSLKDPKPPIPGSGGRLSNSGSSFRIVTDGGVEVNVLESNQYDTMNMADLILTIPGTNTAESAFMGKPMVVSSSWKARIPRGGLGFFLNSLPISGLRRAVMMKVLEKIKFTALPNLISQKPIVPEVVVDDEANEITRVALELMRDRDRMDEMGRRLKEAMGESGAADKIVDAIVEILESKEQK